MEEDEAFDPADISLLGLIAVLPGTDRLADLVEEPGFRRTRSRSLRRRLLAATYHSEPGISEISYLAILHGDLPYGKFVQAVQFVRKVQ